MAEKGGVKGKATAASEIEAEIRRDARPVLSPEERKRKGAELAARDARLAAARAREAAEAQMKRAEEWEAEAAKHDKQAGKRAADDQE